MKNEPNPGLAARLELLAKIAREGLEFECCYTGYYPDDNKREAWSAHNKPELFAGSDWEDWGVHIVEPPQMVDLGPEDVPPGSAVRQIGSSRWIMVQSIDEQEVKCGGWANIPFSILRTSYEIKRPGYGWEACEKPAPAVRPDNQ